MSIEKWVEEIKNNVIYQAYCNYRDLPSETLKLQLIRLTLPKHISVREAFIEIPIILFDKKSFVNGMTTNMDYDSSYAIHKGDNVYEFYIYIKH